MHKKAPPAAFLLSGVVVFAALFGAIVNQAHAAVEISDGSIRALYHLEDGIDSANGYNLTGHNGAGFVPALLSNGANVGPSNSSEYLDATSSLGISGGTITMGVWYYSSSTYNDAPGGALQILMQQNDAGTHTAYLITTGDDGTNNDVLFVRCKEATGCGWTCQSGSAIVQYYTTLSVGWHYLMLAYDSGSSIVTGYIDGLNVGTATGSGNGSSGGSNDFSLFTLDNSGQYNYAPGLEDEAFVANAILSTTTRDALYNNGTGQEICLTAGCGGSSATVSLDSIGQYQANASDTVPDGGTVSGNTVVFKGVPSSTGSSSLKFEVEYTTSSFANVANVTSTATASSGATMSLTKSGLPDGSYQWQGRAIDVGGASSSWHEFDSGMTNFMIDAATSSPYQAEISDGSVKALYHFKSVIPFSDASLNSHTLTDANGINPEPGLLGDAMDAGSSNSSKYLDAASNLGIQGGTITMGFWYYASTSYNDPPGGALQIRMSQNDSASHIGYLITTGDDGSDNDILFARCRDGGNNGWTCQSGSPIVKDTTTLSVGWHYLMLTYDASSSILTGYVDNQNVGTDSGSGNGVSGGTNNFNMFAINNGGAYNFAPGVVDEAFVADKILSTSTRNALWNGGAGAEVCVVAGCATSILTANGLGQYMSDASTPISEGATTTESTVVFKATLDSAGTSTERLEVEVRPLGVPFSNIANVTSTYVSPESIATATAMNLANESFHWQARVMDYNGTASAWQSVAFHDFTVALPMSAHFNGSSSWAWPASNVEFGATNPWTIEFWYRTPAPTSSVLTFLSSRSGAGLEGYSIEKDSDQGIFFTLSCDSGIIEFHGAAASSTDPHIIRTYDTQGVWHHIAVTKNSSTTADAFHLYFDGGSQVITVNASSSLSGNCFSTSTDSIWFGNEPNTTSTNHAFTGDLDEVQIWNTERSAADTARTMSQEATSTTGLRGLWQFNGSSTETVITHATSGQVEFPSFATSSPFGHFLLDQNQILRHTSAHGNHLDWYYSDDDDDWREVLFGEDEDFGVEIASATAVWNLEGSGIGGVNIASTTNSSTADLIISNIPDVADMPWSAQWLAATSTTYGFVQLNDDVLENGGYSAIQIEDTILHEFGHALGLDHSYFGNVMNSYTTDRVDLGVQDKKDYDYLNGEGIWGN